MKRGEKGGEIAGSPSINSDVILKLPEGSKEEGGGHLGGVENPQVSRFTRGSEDGKNSSISSLGRESEREYLIQPGKKRRVMHKGKIQVLEKAKNGETTSCLGKAVRGEPKKAGSQGPSKDLSA